MAFFKSFLFFMRTDFPWARTVVKDAIWVTTYDLFVRFCMHVLTDESSFAVTAYHRDHIAAEWRARWGPPLCEDAKHDKK